MQPVVAKCDKLVQATELKKGFFNVNFLWHAVHMVCPKTAAKAYIFQPRQVTFRTKNKWKEFHKHTDD